MANLVLEKPIKTKKIIIGDNAKITWEPLGKKLIIKINDSDKVVELHADSATVRSLKQALNWF